MPDNQPNEQEDIQEVPLLELIGRMVDAAMQAHKVYTPEVSNTIGQIIKVADELSKPEFEHDEHYLRYGMIDFKQMYGVKMETLFRALAIYKQAIADLSGLTIEQVEKEIRKYRVE